MLSDDQKQMWIWVLLAGTAGAFVRVLISPMSKLNAFLSALGGSLSAGFIAPGVISLIQGCSFFWAMAISFVVGLLGMTGCKAIVQLGEERLPWLFGRYVDRYTDRIENRDVRKDANRDADRDRNLDRDTKRDLEHSREPADKEGDKEMEITTEEEVV